MKTRTLIYFLSFVILQPLLTLRLHAQDDVESLLRYMPSNSNVIAVVHVDQILESPRAKREGWKEEDMYFLAGAETIPTWADTIVLATQFQPGDARSWTASALSCPAGVSVQAMARDERKELQELGGVDAMHTARDAYFLQLSPTVLGVMHPALRQEASRWARSVSRASRPQLSSYLLNEAQSPSQIVMAIDMLDMLDPRLVRHRLEQLDSLKGKEGVITELVKRFQGLQGAALHIQIEEKTQARLELTFSEELPSRADALKSLLLEMLADENVLLAGLRDGTPAVEGQVFSMSAELGDQDLRRALSLIMSPYPTTPTDSGAIANTEAERPSAPITNEPKEDEQDAEEAMRRNRKYYVAVNRALQDADRMTTSALDYKQSSGYLDRYASKIDNLPREGVDPVLLNFAATCADQLRTLAASTRVMVTDVNTQEGTITTRVTSAGATPVVTGVYGGGWWRRGGVTWGYAPHWNVDSNLQEVRERQAASISNFSASAETIRLQLQNLNAQVKREMEAKYGPDFTKFLY